MAAWGSFRIGRRVTAALEQGRSEPADLSAWRGSNAYVLLADPGAGKTEAFRAEAQSTGAAYVKARDLVALRHLPPSRDGTLFIDGLDEMRAGSDSHNTPLDQIRQRLVELGQPRFRLACREADWIGAVDADALRAVTADGWLEVLRLEALDEHDVLDLLRHAGTQVPDADAFWAEAQRRSLASLLFNPLVLDLMIEAVSGGHWPPTRSETFRLACAKLASESNPAHRAERRRGAPSVEEVLGEAAMLCAVLLLAGAEAYTLEPEGAVSTDIDIESVQGALGLRSPKAALSSKLFIADGERRLPRHRTIAEYLAARAVAQRVGNGLPVTRVLALMCGMDGGIVEPLRGMHAWMAALCATDRRLLIGRDPLGVVLYGDVSGFAAADKRHVLRALGREAERFVWFRSGNWAAHPFGALATDDMTPSFVELLESAERSPAHQSLIDCVLDAVRFGQPLPALTPSLERVARDPSYRDDVRCGALQAWLAQPGYDPAQTLTLLEDLHSGGIVDSQDEMIGLLLEALYPDHVPPAIVMRYFRPPKDDGFIGWYHVFWAQSLIPKTPVSLRGALADGIAALSVEKSGLSGDHGMQGIVGALIACALEASGEQAPVERLHAWLQTGLDAHGSIALEGRDREGIRNWLSDHPAVQKTVLAHTFAAVDAGPNGAQRRLWQCEHLLYGAKRPRDWFRWLLDVAGGASSPELARFCFDHAAHAAIELSADYDIAMEDLEQWVQAHRSRWPEAGGWLSQAWSRPIDDFAGEDQRRQRKHQAERLKDQETRQREISAHWAAIRDGSAPAGLMRQLALAYRGRFSDIHGETPESKLHDYLGGGAEEIAAAITGLQATLLRNDLPTVAEILQSGLAQREHFIRPACLLGAELASARDPDVSTRWSDDLAARLVAFWLSDGTGDEPAWYSQLQRQRPFLVAEVLHDFAKPWLRKYPDRSIPGLWSLAQSDELRELARAVLPRLLQGFPSRANEAQLRRLNQELLPAAVRHLNARELVAIADARLALKTLDAGQRIAWWVAGLSLDPEARSSDLVKFVGDSQTRAVQLGVALVAQADRFVAWNQIPAAVLARLIELIAPHASPERPTGDFWVGDADNRRDLVHTLVRRLAAASEGSVGKELMRLRQLPGLARWTVALDSALSENTRVVRAAGFSHASPQSAALMLANREPANSPDLSALVIDHLRTLAAHIVGDETNRGRLFWREDAQRGALPEVENVCRDVLLGLMRDRLLQLSVQLEKEATAAADTRADLRASTVVDQRRIVVPIEIKKEDHRAVWTAWRDQLDGRYVTDPAADGNGIYLVLWFGHRPRASAKGIKPKNAVELEEALRAQIPEHDRLRLAVVVIDLSRPQPCAR